MNYIGEKVFIIYQKCFFILNICPTHNKLLFMKLNYTQDKFSKIQISKPLLYTC